MSEPGSSWITMDQLRIGLYVYLDLKWFEHPFAFNNFKIKDEGQIKIIRSLGLKKCRYDPARSDLKPPPVQTQVAIKVEKPPVALPTEHPALAAKRALIEKIKLQREASARVENAFVDTANGIHQSRLSHDAARIWFGEQYLFCVLAHGASLLMTWRLYKNRRAWLPTAVRHEFCAIRIASAREAGVY